ncbi:MAG: hypothetical protein IJG52_04700 [Lachnospiraceae bacterium]|nr:hypothetical protein [Lachnospiraceae bacterium]MBQ3392696.1 hypothetical protein [Lachnospiraceae bacterium]
MRILNRRTFAAVRIAAVFAAMLLCVTGCGKKKAEEGSTAPEQTSVSAEEASAEPAADEATAEPAAEAPAETDAQAAAVTDAQATAVTDAQAAAETDAPAAAQSSDAAAAQSSDAVTAQSSDSTAADLPQQISPAVFSGETQNFSFLLDAGYPVRESQSGAAEIRIEEDSNMSGLSVSVQASDNLADPSEIMEEDVFNAKQTYGSALQGEPESDQLDIPDHEVYSVSYAYTDDEGRIVDRREMLEVRDGYYIYYKTREHRDHGQEALFAAGAAMSTLRLDAAAYADAGIPAAETWQ